MTASAFGWFGLFTTAITLATTLGSLGLRQSFTYQIGQRKMTAGQAVGTGIALWPALTAVSALVLVLLYGDADTGLDKGDLVVVMTLAIAGAMLGMLLQGVFLGRGEIRLFSITESAPRLALMVGIVVSAGGASLSLLAAMWSYAVSFVATLPVVAWLALRRVGPLGIRLRQLPAMMSYGFVFALNLFLITLCTRLAMFLLEHFHGAASAGKYYAAAMVNEIFLEAATAMGMVVFANAARQSRETSTVHRNARISCLFLWLFMMMAALLIIAAPWLVSLLGAEKYGGAAPVLQILALGLAPSAASRVIYNTIAGTGKPLFGTPVIAMSLIVSGLLAYMLIPAHGAPGGALAVVIGQYLLFIGYAFNCRARYRVPIKEFFVPQKRDLSHVLREVRMRLRPAI